MHNYYPILWVGAIIGVISTLLIVAAFVVKDGEKETGFERNMKDSEIMQRLMDYAKPFYRQFIVVGFLMLFSIAYDIISPLIVGKIEELVVGKFALNTLFLWVAGYAAILLVSMACTYFQAVILQKTGQKIISNMREDLFVHIERLSHEQLNEIPVGKLVTRTTNDTNAISLMFTNLLVNLLKNFFVIIGILIAMLFLNYELTLMVLCFVPFIVLFSIIFRKFSRRAHRKVKDCTTDINTYLSENLSGMKITQIFNREDAKMREFTDKSNALGRAQQEQIFVFGIFRPLVYMLYISSVLLPFVFRRQGLSGGNVVPRPDAHQRYDRQLLHVYFKILQPDPEPGGAVQLAAVRICIRRESILDSGSRAKNAGCAGCDRAYRHQGRN